MTDRPARLSDVHEIAAAMPYARRIEGPKGNAIYQVGGMLMGNHAVRTPVDRRHREGPQLEIRFVHTRVADDVHPETRAQVVVLAVEEAAAAVEHVVHAHDRRGAQR